MKKLSLLAVSLLVVVASGVQAQNQSDEMTQRLDSLQQVVNNMSNTNQELEQERLNRVVWKDRAKYFNLGYVKQTLTDKSTGIELQSDFGVSLSSGKTYYLHKKPLAGMIKFGLDWTWMDLNYAKSTLPELDPETGSVDESAVHQAEFSMQFGPSVTQSGAPAQGERLFPGGAVLFGPLHERHVPPPLRDDVECGLRRCVERDLGRRRVALGIGQLQRTVVRRIELRRGCLRRRGESLGGGHHGRNVGAEAQVQDLVDADLPQLPLLISSGKRIRRRPATLRAVVFLPGAAAETPRGIARGEYFVIFVVAI